MVVVICDDDVELAQYLCEYLEKKGHKVVTAQDGIKGANVIEIVRPDLLICDFNLPGKDGLNLCREVRRNPALHKTFIIMISAHPNILKHEDIHYLLPKPFTLEVFQKILDKIKPIGSSTIDGES